MTKRMERAIIREIRSGRFAVTVHARERMNERFVSDLDIVEVARTLESIRHQEHNDTYLLVGRGTWQEELVVSAALRDGVIIVTVFFED